MGKHKAKRGRPAKPYENPAEVALNARMKHTGLPRPLAGHERAGTVLGRLRLLGMRTNDKEGITEPQYEAGTRFLEAYTKKTGAIMPPAGLEKVNPGANADEPTEDYLEWAIAAVARFWVVRDRLTDDQWHVIDWVVINDREHPDLGLLKAALTVCARSYGLIGQKEAA
jgi:hypothetical protein